MYGIGAILVTVGLVLRSATQEQRIARLHERHRRAESTATAAVAVSLAKSQSFFSVCHDLRQAVYAIGLHLDPLAKLSKAGHDESAKQAVEGIRASWQFLDDLLARVVDLNRLDSGAVEVDLQPIEVASLVRSLIAQYRVVAGRVGVRLVALVKGGVFANADHLMLRRVLSNLVDNAIAFSPPRSTVAVVLRYSPDACRLQVRDAGVGIAREAHEAIFEERALDAEGRERSKGLGLGLAISRRLLVLMNGNITVRSAPGRGCCMTVTLAKAAATKTI